MLDALRTPPRLKPATAEPRVLAAAPSCQPPWVPPNPITAPVLVAEDLSVHAGPKALLRGVDLVIEAGAIYALVGPSGVGKTTLLRCFNRLIDLVPGLRVGGAVTIGGHSVYASNVDVDRLRARVGMLFQQPVVFPKSIYDNVLFGLRRVGAARGAVHRREWPERVEAALTQAGLWSEVADRLRAPAVELSVGQQQRLCLARALALEPEVLLMDEPTSALDAASAAAIERMIRSLAGRTTILLVTHDAGQAARVADVVVRMESRDGAGVIAEHVLAKQTCNHRNVPHEIQFSKEGNA